MATTDANIFGMEVTLRAVISINAHALLWIGLHLEVAMNDERTTGLNELRIMTEALQIGLFCAIDIEVVGISSSNHRSIGTQMMKRAVELISFYHHIGRIFAQQVVGTIIFRNTTQESITAHVAFVQ